MKNRVMIAICAAIGLPAGVALAALTDHSQAQPIPAPPAVIEVQASSTTPAEPTPDELHALPLCAQFLYLQGGRDVTTRLHIEPDEDGIRIGGGHYIPRRVQVLTRYQGQREVYEGEQETVWCDVSLWGDPTGSDVQATTQDGYTYTAATVRR